MVEEGVEDGLLRPRCDVTTRPSLLYKKVPLTSKKSTVNQEGSDRLFAYHKKGFCCVGCVDTLTFTRIQTDGLARLRKGVLCVISPTEG